MRALSPPMPSSSRRSSTNSGAPQGHSVIVKTLHDRLPEAIKGCVRGGALLARHPPREPQPSPKAEPDDNISTSTHRSVRYDTGLSAAAWQTASFSRHL